jgi:hypothetical protein
MAGNDIGLARQGESLRQHMVILKCRPIPNLRSRQMQIASPRKPITLYRDDCGSSLDSVIIVFVNGGRTSLCRTQHRVGTWRHGGGTRSFLSTRRIIDSGRPDGAWTQILHRHLRLSSPIANTCQQAEIAIGAMPSPEPQAMSKPAAEARETSGLLNGKRGLKYGIQFTTETYR